jgi:hypothetical protein
MTPSAQMLEFVSRLDDDWDGEGAPRPSPDAVARAANVLDWAEATGVEVDEVDGDVLGGVAIYLQPLWPRAPRIWIACMNTGSDTAVWSDASRVIRSSNVDATAWEELDRFLQTNLLSAPRTNMDMIAEVA